MSICEFCLQRREDGQCGLGLKLPTRISCRDFEPGIEKFCANPSDFKGASQIIQMATFFEFKGKELKKIKQVALEEEELRLKLSRMIQANALAVGS
jgi:hypothetical protein